MLHDAFDAAQVAAVRAALDPFAAASEVFLRSRENGRFAIARAGEISFSPVYKRGTPEDFPWHQDDGHTYVEPQQYLTCCSTRRRGR